MRLLLDTHIALWAVVGSPALPARAADAIMAADEVFVSVCSLWEIAIKRSLSKASMPITAAQALAAFDDAGYLRLDIRPAHALRVEALPALHRDPFDRLLVAQAQAEPLLLLTADPLLARYGSAVMAV